MMLTKTLFQFDSNGATLLYRSKTFNEHQTRSDTISEFIDDLESLVKMPFAVVYFNAMRSILLTNHNDDPFLKQYFQSTTVNQILRISIGAENLMKALDEYQNSFAQSVLKEVQLNQKIVSTNKKNKYSELLKITATSRAKLAKEFNQNTIDNSFGSFSLKSLHSKLLELQTKENEFGVKHVCSKILTTEVYYDKGRYSDQYAVLLKALANNNKYSFSVLHSQAAKFDKSLLKLTEIKIPSNPGDPIVIHHTRAKNVEKALEFMDQHIDLAKMLAYDLTKPKEKELFAKMASDIYYYTCQIAPFKRGSALISHMMVATVFLAKGLALPDFQALELMINPDIMCFIVPAEDFFSKYFSKVFENAMASSKIFGPQIKESNKNNNREI